MSFTSSETCGAVPYALFPRTSVHASRTKCAPWTRRSRQKINVAVELPLLAGRRETDCTQFVQRGCVGAIARNAPVQLRRQEVSDLAGTQISLKGGTYLVLVHAVNATQAGRRLDNIHDGGPHLGADVLPDGIQLHWSVRGLPGVIAVWFHSVGPAFGIHLRRVDIGNDTQGLSVDDCRRPLSGVTKSLHKGIVFALGELPECVRKDIDEPSPERNSGAREM